MEDGVLNADERGELESKDGMLDTYGREGLGSWIVRCTGKGNAGLGVQRRFCRL